MDALAHARLAIQTAAVGDRPAAEDHLATAALHARGCDRRHRQVVEIAALLVTGRHERAAGLALVHAQEFPDDAELLGLVHHPPSES